MTDLLQALETGDMQALIDAGAWSLEGSVGRSMMAAIEDGRAILGPEPARTYWGSKIPAWWQVEPGTVGSPEFAEEHGWVAPEGFDIGRRDAEIAKLA